MRIIAFLLLAISAARADVVVSIRYFKSVGTSHWHLHLFREDGTLIRQLTAPEDANDMNPVFRDDGSKIVFIRRKKAGDTWMEIATAGGKPRALAAKPGGLDAVFAEKRPEVEEPKAETIKRNGRDYTAYTVPGVGTKVLLHNGPTEYEDGKVESGWLVQEGKEIPFSKLPGFDGYHCQTQHGGGPFLKAPAPPGVLFHGHHDSSTGDSLQVIDLKNPRVITLWESDGQMHFPSAGSGFFCVSQERYQPLAGTKMTVNCWYLDYWDAQFRRTRFASKLALFGGASIRMKGTPQLEIPGNQ